MKVRAIRFRCYDNLWWQYFISRKLFAYVRNNNSYELHNIFVKSRILLTIDPFHQPVIKFQWKIGFCFAQFLAIISQWQHNCRVMCATFLRSLFQKLNLSTTISVELELCWKTHQWDGPAFCLLSAWTSWEITQLSHGSLGVHWLFCGRKQLYWGQWLLYRGPFNKMCILGGIARYVSI